MEGESLAISALDLPENARDFIQYELGIQSLYPPQSEAMESIFARRNLVLAIPTASGKSMVAFIGILNQLLNVNPGTKAIYVVPLKALASEKYDDLKQIGDALGLEVGLGVGDASSEIKNIKNCDILVCTSEKLDSIMRNQSEVVSNVSIVVSDEFHLLNDPSRGPTLEINLTKLRHYRPDAQIIALSATVGNTKELAKWLDAELVQSEWRPVTLEYSTLHDLHLEPRMALTGSKEESKNLSMPRSIDGPRSHPAAAVLDDTINENGQILIFVSTRRSAVSEAVKLSNRLKKRISKEDPHRLAELQELSQKLTGRNQSSIATKLAECIEGGVAFHHAGLTNAQRKLVEDSFKQRALTALVATPTLAAGVNLPARRVLVRDIKRWSDGMNRPLPIMEVRQMLGRAGRPKYDTKGEAWLLCKGGDGFELADSISDHYFFGDVEDVISKLSSDSAMRMHLLSLIATGGITHKGDIDAFFSATFLAMDYPRDELKTKISSILEWLENERFIFRKGVDVNWISRIDEAIDEQEEWDDSKPSWLVAAESIDGLDYSFVEPQEKTTKSNASFGLGFSQASSIGSENMVQIGDSDDPATEYEATRIGEAVSQMYLDPLSASIIRTGLRRAIRRIVRKSSEVRDFSLMHLVCSTPDFVPLFPKTEDLKDGSLVWMKYSNEEEFLLVESDYYSRIHESQLGLIKSALLIDYWMDESTLRVIEKELDVMPGDVNQKTDVAQWLLAASRNILLYDDVFAEQHMWAIAELSSKLETLRDRVRHGCKEDLLGLVRVKHLGRARARELAKINIRTPEDFFNMTDKQRREVVSWRGWGPVLYDKIFAEVEKVSKNVIKTSKFLDDDTPLEGELN